MKKVLVLLIACLFLVSCASKSVKKQGPGELYVDGVNLMKQKSWDKAIHKFGEITENYPFDPLSLVAAVKLGDSYFEKKDYVMAASVYENFASSHPEDENAPYVAFRLGECYERLSLSIDRDQANTLKAIEKYTFLKNKYPRSTYVQTVDERMEQLEQKLADREMYVGEFYYRTSQYNASVVRLEYFLKKYPKAKGIDKAYFYLAMSYKELANPEKSDYYSEKLKAEFPKSVYARSTIRERKTLKITDSKTPAPSAVQASKSSPAESEGLVRKKLTLDDSAGAAAAKPVEPPKTVKEDQAKTRASLPKETATADADVRPAKPAPLPEPGQSEARTYEMELVDKRPSGSDETPPASTESMVKAPKPAEKAKEEPARTRKPKQAELTRNMYEEQKPAEPPAKKAGEGSAAKKADEGSAEGAKAADAGKPKEAAKPEKDKKKDLDFFDKSKPIDIVSDSMEGFDKEKYVVFIGNVIAKQEDLYIFADRIEAYLNEESNEIDRAYAKDNVKIVKKERTATSKEAFFENRKGEIILKGNVVVFQGQDKLTGDVVTYYVNEDRAVVEASTGKRARVILTPNK